MHVGAADDIALRSDNDYGEIPLLIAIDEDRHDSEINKCLTCRYGNATKIGIEVRQARKRMGIKNHTT